MRCLLFFKRDIFLISSHFELFMNDNYRVFDDVPEQPEWAKGRRIKFKEYEPGKIEYVIACLTFLLWDLRETIPEIETLFDKYGIEILDNGPKTE